MTTVSLSQPEPLRLGIIGTGEIVRMILPALRETEHARVTAIAGSSPARAVVLAAELPGATACADYRELLKSGLVDAVYIATPPSLHCEMAAAAMTAGKHVVCEKPLVTNRTELRELAALTLAYPELMFAGCSSRFHVCPPVRAAKAMIARGTLGRLETVRLVNALDLPLPLAGQRPWKRTREQSGGGLLMDWGVYDLDWLFHLLGAPFDPIAVLGEVSFTGDEGSGLETGYAARILCRDSFSVTVERRPEQGPPVQRGEVRGTEGGIDLPFMPGGPSHPGVQWHRYRQRGQLVTESVAAPMCEWGPILAYPVIDFLRSLREGNAVASPFARQAAIHAVIDAWYESARTGQSVAITP